jgi:hypothetical protein
MKTGRKLLIAYFIVLAILSALAQSALGVMIVVVLTLGFGTPLLIAAPTLLLYSVALLPAGLAMTHRPRRALTIVAALALPLGVAVVPGAISQTCADRYADRMGRQDFARAGQAQPRSIELIGDVYDWGVFEGSLQVGDQRAPCSALCRALLFNREVERVRMTKHWGDRAPQSVTYHLEHRDSCPPAYPARTSSPEQAFRDRLDAGDCLIAEADSASPMAAAVSFTTLYSRYRQNIPPADAPPLTRIDSIKRLVIERREDGSAKPVPVVVRTETTIAMLTLPFYFGYEESMAGHTGHIIAPLVKVTHQIDLVDALRHTVKDTHPDLADALRDTFSFKIAPIEPLH